MFAKDLIRGMLSGQVRGLATCGRETRPDSKVLDTRHCYQARYAVCHLRQDYLSAATFSNRAMWLCIRTKLDTRQSYQARYAVGYL